MLSDQRELDSRSKSTTGRRLQEGDAVPHFIVSGLTGGRAAYAEIWQRRNLVLVRLTDPSPSAELPLAAGLAPLDDDDTALVVTRASIDGIPESGVVVADRWGEIAFASHAPADAGLPAAGEILAWLDFVRRRCPECEGETR